MILIYYSSASYETCIIFHIKINPLPQKTLFRSKYGMSRQRKLLLFFFTRNYCFVSYKRNDVYDIIVLIIKQLKSCLLIIANDNSDKNDLYLLVLYSKYFL
jgi:hypothetical protein